MLGRLIGERIALTTALDPDLRNLSVDPGQIQQVLMNLVVNARDAMPEGGRIVITHRATPIAFPDGGRDARRAATVPASCSTVRDTGHGMTPQTRAQIFEPFFTTKPEGKGTGPRAWPWSTASSGRAAAGSTSSATSATARRSRSTSRRRTPSRSRWTDAGAAWRQGRPGPPAGGRGSARGPRAGRLGAAARRPRGVRGLGRRRGVRPLRRARGRLRAAAHRRRDAGDERTRAGRAAARAQRRTCS